MKFDYIELGTGSNTVTLPIFGLTNADPYVVKAVDGLGPPERDIFFADSGASTGGRYQGQRAQSRVIVIRIGLNPNYSGGESASDLRHKIYRLMSTGGYQDQQTIRLKQTGVTTYYSTYGWIKRVEAVPWSKDPEVQITMECPEPYLMEMPSSRQSIPETKGTFTIENPGNAPSPFGISITFTASVTDFTMTQQVGGYQKSGQMKIIGGNFVSGDKLEIYTAPGTRDVIVYRNGSSTYENLADKMAANWEWLQFVGNGQWAMSNTNFDWNFFRFSPMFWGI